MMFENMPASNFNPMRDVWFPLDLSNPASFNAIMAHSAAHLAHYYGGMTPTRGTNSSEALKFKADAIQILNHWLSDPEKALSNDAFAAVVRLLTFEVSPLFLFVFLLPIGLHYNTNNSVANRGTGAQKKNGKFIGMASRG